MTLKVWNLDALDDPLQDTFEHHTEFVIGLDFNLFVEGQLASCSWDECVEVFNHQV